MRENARPMTAAEKYYAFLDATWPMNLMLVAELERDFRASFVHERWQAFSADRILTRMRATPDLTIIDGGHLVDFAAGEVTEDDLVRELAREALIRHGMDRPLICRYWIDPDRSRSWICLIGHHSVVDARGGVAELQQFVRFLGGDQLVPQRGLSAPEPARQVHAWQNDRQAYVSLLREIGAENRAAGPPGPASWPDRSLPRRPRFGRLDLDAAQTRGMLETAAAEGTRLFPALAAAAMAAAARTTCGRSDKTLQLNVPADLTSSRDQLDRPPPMKVGVLSQRHRLPLSNPWETARDVATALARTRAHGGDELFFHLARVDRIDSFPGGVRLVSDGVSSAPPAVSVTNLGVVDDRGDPRWLRGVAAYQAPTPNQIISSIGLGYRGRQVITVATDDARIAADRAERLVRAYGDEIGAMGARRPAAP